ncbi:YciI family protein [Paludibaculum fermentans]|uniref:YciI family protein n=1 Tax=Paludibaculum fermentans TaxID=1473598 RepID=UPI003EB7E16C
MRFLCLYRPGKPEGTPPTHEEMMRMGQFVQESFQSGVLLATEGCLPSIAGARLRMTAGRFAVTDGPFAEAKEIVGGFALIRAESKEQAIEFTKRFMEIAGDGETEIRQVFEAGDGPCA